MLDGGWWMVDIWKLDIKNEQLAKKKKNMFHKLIRSPNAKKLSTLFRGLHFYPTKTTIKLNQNKILGLFNLSVWDFQNQRLLSWLSQVYNPTSTHFPQRSER